MSELTVVIPTRNRRESLLRAIESLSLQTADGGTFDVLVVADGCTDGTSFVVEQRARTAAWADRGLVCVEQAWQGAAAARNTGLRLARGRVVLFLDDDVAAEPDLIASHLRHHEPDSSAERAGQRGAVVVGRIEPIPRPEVVHRQIRRWWGDHYRRLATRAPVFADVFTGNVSVPRAAALAVGGFDETLDYVEDVEFGFRLASAGLRIVYEAQAKVRTTNAKSGAALLTDLRRSGRGSVRVHRKHPEVLAELPLGGYGETNLRLRLAQGSLLWASRLPPIESAIRTIFEAWATRTRPSPLDRRIFDVVRAYEFWSGVRSEAQSDEWSRYSSAGVPVLVYHSVQPRPAADAGPYVVASSAFARQLSVIRLLGYTVRPLEEVVDAWTRGIPPPPRTLAITFDDGYRDNLVHVWPVLRRHSYAATLFVVPGLLGGSSIWDEGVGPGPRPLMTAAELVDLDRQGFRVQSHGVTHADLREVSATVAADEIVDSRRQLEKVLSRRVDLFAYPYGHDNATTRRLAAAAGYRAAFATRWGLNTAATPRFGLRRITVAGTDHLLVFAIKVWVGDNPFRHVSDFFRRLYLRTTRQRPTRAQRSAR